MLALEFEESVRSLNSEARSLLGYVKDESEMSGLDALLLTPSPPNAHGLEERVNVLGENSETEEPSDNALGWFNEFCDNVIGTEYGTVHQEHISTGKRLAVI